jgi:hypothetical protein
MVELRRPEPCGQSVKPAPASKFAARYLAIMIQTEAGQVIEVRDAFGQLLRRRALGPVQPGYDFPVVRVCREEEWHAAELEGREAEGVPWPAEDVVMEHEDIGA